MNVIIVIIVPGARVVGIRFELLVDVRIGQMHEGVIEVDGVRVILGGRHVHKPIIVP